MPSTLPPRRIDHIVMPVVSVGASRRFFEALGFTVAPTALHPFGTANACVFFADGTYLEPLGIADETAYAEAAREGSVFVGRDAAHRFRRGAPGLSGIAIGSDDAEADWRALDERGLADGDLFQFARSFETPGGETRELVFRLAFARDRRSPDLFFFTVQALAKTGDRSSLMRHANGTTGIARLVLSEFWPVDFEAFLTDVAVQAIATEVGDSRHIATANAAIEVLTPAALARRYGGPERCGERGLRLEGIVLSVADTALVEAMAARVGLPARWQRDSLVVHLAGDTGPFLAFEIVRREA